MDKKEALNKYVRKYILKLTSPTMTKNVEKALRKSFSEANNLESSSRFSMIDVAEEVASILNVSARNGMSVVLVMNSLRPKFPVLTIYEATSI